MTQLTDSLPAVVITTDGASRGNPGPGGWAALLQAGARERLLSGEGPEHTTNNAMEIYAVIAALESLKRACQITLRADSQYVINGMRRLQTSSALPAKNRELWARLKAAAAPHTITFEWVRGHNGDERNERVDRAANAAAARAYLATERERPADTAACAETWTLAICSAAADRPVRWELITPAGRRGAEVAPARRTQPTVVYQALVDGLAAAIQIAGAAQAGLNIVSNYELIIKQGRGEWRVRNPDQRPLAEQAAQLRARFGAAQFSFMPTEQVLKLIDAAPAGAR